jgi:hypothetical protein
MLRDVHVLGVAQPEGLELAVRQRRARAAPQILGLFPARQQFGGIVRVQLLRRGLAAARNPGAKAIDPLRRAMVKSQAANGRRDQTGRWLKRPDKRVLRDFARVGVVAAGLEDERVNTIFVAADQFLKGRESPAWLCRARSSSDIDWKSIATTCFSGLEFWQLALSLPPFSALL